MRSLLAPSLVVVLVASATGCTDTDSTDLATNNMTATFHVDVDADPKDPKTEVYGFLDEGEKGLGSSGVILTGDDNLFVSTDKEKDILMTRVLDNQYRPANDIKGLDRTFATIALKRTKGVSALNSTIQLIPPANITEPAPNATITYGDGTGAVTIKWTKFDKARQDFFIYPCGSAAIAVADDKVDDLGESQVPISRLVSSKPSAPTCISIRLDRYVTNGVIDPGFHGGSTFEQARFDHVDVNVVP